MLYSGLFIFSVFISSLSQIMLKKSALKHYKDKISEYLNAYVITAYGIFFTSSMLTVISYKHVPISYGPIFESLGYIFVGVLSYFFLKEKPSKRKLCGMLVIIIGIIVFSI
jgi:small multidrug resistance pump